MAHSAWLAISAS
jgi:hypothetical protein